MKNKLSLQYFSQTLFCLLIVYLFAFSGCASRERTPVTLKDSTIFYPAKFEKVLFKGISLSNKISKKTGRPIKPGIVFKLDDKAKLYASIENVFSKSKVSMLHVDWIDSKGNSFYRKRIDISPKDSLVLISSAISISTQKRDTGTYSVRFYLYRELFAEKKFQLVEAKTDSISTKKKKTESTKKQSLKKEDKKKKIKPMVKVENITANITLCRYISKKTGKLIGTDSSFTIKDKGKVKAVVNIENRDIKTNQQMSFYFEWIGPDGKSFYRKKVVYTTSNPSFTISNSISITPEKRLPGNYNLRITYRKKIIAEKKFELVLPEQ